MSKKTKISLTLTQTELDEIDASSGKFRSKYVVGAAIYVRDLGRRNLFVLRTAGWGREHILHAVNSLSGTFLGPPYIEGDVERALQHVRVFDEAQALYGISPEDWRVRVKETRQPAIESALVTLSEIWPYSEGLRRTIETVMCVE